MTLLERYKDFSTIIEEAIEINGSVSTSAQCLQDSKRIWHEQGHVTYFFHGTFTHFDLPAKLSSL